MSIFLFLYFLFLGFFHYFFYLKLKILLPFSNFGKTLYILFSIILILMPFLARVMERNGFVSIPSIILFIFYIWLAYIFIFTFFGVLTLPLNLIPS
ncbi:MAG: hypothetical protein WHV67_07185, partial [Thermoanaerobaculia bacterium]